MLWRVTWFAPLTATCSTIHAAFDPCNALRALMTIVAPRGLVEPSRRAYFDLRDFGDRIAEGLRTEDPEYGVRRTRHDQVLGADRCHVARLGHLQIRANRRLHGIRSNSLKGVVDLSLGSCGRLGAGSVGC